MARILVLSKRQYMNKDLIDDRFGRFREIPLALARKGHGVTGLCLSYRAKSEGWTADGPVRWQSLNAGRLKLLGLTRFVAAARRLAQDADIIWACSDSFYGVIAHFLAKNCGRPFVFDLYDNFEYFLAARLPFARQFYRRAVRESRAVTCVSDPLLGLVHSYGKHGDAFVLENAVRKDLFRPMDKRTCRKRLGLPQNCRLLGMAGAITKNRGIDTLFEAFASLKASHPDLRLALAGPRNMEIPADPRIHDFGLLPLEMVPILINALDVAVVCVRDDAFGRYCYPQKAVEIMACDTPIVAANVGSLQQMLRHRPQWLYPPGRSDYLAEVITKRFDDRRTGYTKPATWSESADRLETILLGVLRKPGQGVR